jgi:murein DD-endopeptidase MepM/ murein hydrolase activator NlpD
MRYKKPFLKIGELYGSTHNRPHPHRGLDFPVKAGSKIGSTSAGVVTATGWSDVLGWYAIVKDQVGIYWGYNHMLKASTLTKGQVVKRGGLIGLVGSTGSASTGPHLHLTASKEANGNFAGETLDPLKVLKGK